MNTDDLAARLRSAAEAARDGEEWFDVEQLVGSRYMKRTDAVLVALANPENVLALLDERAKLRAALVGIRERLLQIEGAKGWVLDIHNPGEYIDSVLAGVPTQEERS